MSCQSTAKIIGLILRLMVDLIFIIRHILFKNCLIALSMTVNLSDEWIIKETD